MVLHRNLIGLNIPSDYLGKFTDRVEYFRRDENGDYETVFITEVKFPGQYKEHGDQPNRGVTYDKIETKIVEFINNKIVSDTTQEYFKSPEGLEIVKKWQELHESKVKEYINLYTVFNAHIQ